MPYMSYSIMVAKLTFLIVLLAIGCGAPNSNVDSTGESYDTLSLYSYTISDSSAAATSVPDTSNLNTQDIKSEPILEIQQTDVPIQQTDKIQFDTTYIAQNINSFNEDTLYKKKKEYEKKKSYEIQTNKVKILRDTMLSIDEKFKKIEEKIKMNKK